MLADLVWSFPPIFFFCDTVFLLLVSSLLSTLKGLFYSPCSAAQHTVLLPTASNACIARSVGSCTCGMTAAGVGDGEGRNTESDEWLLREAVKGQPRTLFFSIAVYRSLSLTFTWSALSALSPMCRGLTYFLLFSPSLLSFSGVISSFYATTWPFCASLSSFVEVCVAGTARQEPEQPRSDKGVNLCWKRGEVGMRG